MSRIACVAVVKNEQRHIAEWLEYQFVIGFDTVVLLDNRSTDGTIDAALQFAGRRDIRIFDWDHVSKDYQILAYQNAIQRFGDKFDWMAFFDTDEFLVLDPGLNLRDCLAARTDAAAIAVSWAIFGSSGHREMPDGRIIETFTRRSLSSFGPNLHVKSIVRPKTVRACVNAHMFEVDGVYTDLAGRPIAWRQPGLLDREPDYAGGKLHHYFTRSLAHWTEKLARGYPDTKRKFEDFTDYDRNEIFDDSAIRFFRNAASQIPPSGADEDITQRDLFARFVSLGDNCEFGFAQRAAGSEPLQLLRFSGTGDNENGLILALKERFNAFADPDDLLITDDGQGEWIARGRRYVITSHTNLKIADHEHMPVFQDELKKRSFLVRKLVEDLEDGIKIFIRKSNAPVSKDRIFAFHAAMKAYGNPILLWVSIADADHPAATVERLDDNLYQGFIGRLAAYDSANQADLSAWQDLCKAAMHATEGKTSWPPRATPVCASRVAPRQDIIFDLGVSEGNDTAFYLAKGFEVVGVEADIQTYAALRKRFAEPLRNGHLTLYNFAAAQHDSEIVEFFRHDLYQGLSGLSHARAEFQDGNFSRFLVVTVNWPTLIQKHGVPHYLKIDIEGHEGPFLESMIGTSVLPTYASVECHNLGPAKKLFELGYRKFKLIDQQPPGGFRLPETQREGHTISWPEFLHASGPFGQDLPSGPWLDFQEFKSAFDAAQALKLLTWYDCHVWMPE